MKKFIQIAAILLLIVCFADAQAETKHMFELDDYQGVVTVNTMKLAEEQGQLRIVLEVAINGNVTQKYAAMRLTPKLISEDNYLLLPDMVIQGKRKNKTYRRWERTLSKKLRGDHQQPPSLIVTNAETDTTLIYDISVPYRLWMDNAVLALNQEMVTYRDQRSLLALTLGGGVTLEPKIPYNVDPLVNFSLPEAESKNRKKQGQAFLDFQVGRSDIVPEYRRNPEELAKIRTAFNEIVSNEGVKINSLFIEGYASPEGRFASNEKLSNDRSKALMNYILKNFNLPIGQDQISTASVAEDWNGLRAIVMESEIAQKDKIISIIDGTTDPDQREAKLRQMGAVWQTLVRDFFPQLRRVEYQIDFSVKDFSMNESKDMFLKAPELLSQRELYLTAQSYGVGTKEYENIMLTLIPRNYPDDAIALINTAALMIERGEYTSAKLYLEKFSDNPASWNNLGVVYLLENNLDQAQELFEKASRAGVEQAKHNLQEVEKKRSDNIRMKRYTN